MKKPLLILFIIFSVVGSVCLTGAADLSPTTAERAGHNIAGTFSALKQIKVDRGDDTTVPVGARPLLTTLKHELRDVVQECLNASGTDMMNIEKAKECLSAELERQGMVGKRKNIVVTNEGSDDQDYYRYGEIRQIQIHRLTAHPDLAGVTTSIGIPYGVDTSLYLFRKNGQRWELVLAQESNDLKK